MDLKAGPSLLVLFGLLIAFSSHIGQAQDTEPAPAEENELAVDDDADFDEDEVEEADPEDAETLDYEVVFDGLSEGTTKTLLEDVSEARSLVDQPPISLSRLRRRAEGDLPRLLQTLRARGHYRAKVDVAIDQDTTPITVTYTFDRGPVYDINKVTIELNPPTEDDLKLPRPKALNLEKGKRASSTKVIEAESILLEQVKKQGFANATLGPRQVVVDHNTAEMDITFILNAGSKVFFGETNVVGNEEVEARYIRRLLEWKPGKLVTPERLQTTQLNLIETSLFNSVRIEPGNNPDEKGRVPITITVKEAKHRTVEAGIRFRTDEGVGGSAGWEHRNLLGTGEQLGIELDGSRLGYFLTGEAREPDFLRRRQALVIGTELAFEDTDGFESQSIGASIGIERSVGKGMNLSAGVAFRALEVEQDGDREGFGLLSLPVSYSWDHSDDALDPAEGGRFNIQNEPFVDVFGNDVAFNKTSVAYTRYLRLKKTNPRLILAGRTRAGFIFGTERDNVPADERFFAGGGGSVRGFGFQLAGELDDDDDPVGGRSLFETAIELRGQFTDTIGAVVFADSGAAFESTVPDFEEPLRIGVGGGLRYFSPVGPIRLDVGFPLNRRDSDDAFQIYVSIGQAF